MTLPRHYWLADDNTLCMAPVPELEGAAPSMNRQVAAHWRSRPTEEQILDERQRHRRSKSRPSSSRARRCEVGFSVLRSPDGAEQYAHLLVLHWQLHGSSRQPRLAADRHGSQSSLAGGRASAARRRPGRSPWRQTRRCICASSLTAASSRSSPTSSQCLTLRVYPEREDSRGIALFSRGRPAHLRSLKVWQMRSIWPELKGREGQ